jgi:hypothetical protein
MSRYYVELEIFDDDNTNPFEREYEEIDKKIYETIKYLIKVYKDKKRKENK